MDQYGSTYQSGAGSGNSAGGMTEPEFLHLAKNIGSNIEKILQNGKD